MSSVEQPPKEVNAAAINWGPCDPVPPRLTRAELLMLPHIELVAAAYTLDDAVGWWRWIALAGIEALATATAEITRLSRQCHRLRAELRGARGR